MQKPIRQEVAEWKQHKVTKFLIKRLEDDTQEIKEMWAQGAYTLESESGTLQVNSQALGSLKAIGDLLDYLEGDMDSEEAKPAYEH